MSFTATFLLLQSQMRDLRLTEVIMTRQRQCSSIMIHSEIQAQESKFRCQLGVNEATLGKTLLLNNRF